MPKKLWRGSIAIPMTPFDDKDHIDEEALRAELRFCIKHGVGGIATPLMVSEFFNLSEDERRFMIRVAVEECRHTDIPVIANCAAVNTPLAVSYARYTQEIGADAVIAMPPYIERPDFETIRGYYRAIAESVEIPVWIQNAGVAALSPQEIVRLCEENERVRWVKEEVPPSTHSIGRLVAMNSPVVHGVMGGAGGRYLITERDRGSQGVIHACEFCDVVQRIWDLLEQGRNEEAEALFERILPALVAEGLMGMAFAKEIMVRRGIFTNHRVRNRAQPLDKADLREIDRIWRRVEPLLQR